MPNPIDIPQVLAVLRPGEDWGPCAQTDSSYALLAATWRSGLSAVPTQAQMDAQWTLLEANRPAAVRAASQSAGVAATTAPDGPARVLRAVALVLMDEVNVLRARSRAVESALATAPTFAALAATLAGFAPLPDRTAVQVRAAVAAKINSTASD